MSSQIDFRTLPANVPVLCIPRVYQNITEGRIRKIFDDLDMGELEHIDVVPKTSEKGDKFNRVFVHFRRWNNSENANTARERLLNGKEIKIIYDEPWFWKISAYRESERKPVASHQQPSGSSRKATIAFDSDENRSSRPATSTIHREEHRRPDRRPDHQDYRRPDHQDYRRPDNRPDHRDYRRDDRPRRRDDSRERPRRRDDSRERPRRDERKTKPEEKPVVQERPVRKFIEPVTPSNSPPRERPVSKLIESTTPSNSPPRERPNDIKDATVPLTIDYGNIVLPLKKRTFGGKKPEPKTLKIENEDGETSDIEKTKTKNA